MSAKTRARNSWLTGARRARPQAMRVRSPARGVRHSSHQFRHSGPIRRSIASSFLAVALQRNVGAGVPIALPVLNIGELLGCHWTMVGKYRKFAIEDGLLHKSAEYIAHQKAAEYCLDLSKLIPLSPDKHTSALTRDTRITNDLVRMGIASGENQLPSGENATKGAPTEHGDSESGGYLEIML